MASVGQKMNAIAKLKEYFQKKGGVHPTMAHYRNANDAPISWRDIKRIFGSYSVMVKMVGPIKPEVKIAPKKSSIAAKKETVE